jgi:hypothetical protein
MRIRLRVSPYRSGRTLDWIKVKTPASTWRLLAPQAGSNGRIVGNT